MYNKYILRYNMTNKIDLRPTEEESCSGSVIRFYHDLVETQHKSVWVLLLIKHMYRYMDDNYLALDYFNRITFVIDTFLESGIDSTLAIAIQ